MLAINLYLNLGYNVASKRLEILSVVELRTPESDQYLLYLHTNEIVRFPQTCTMKKVFKCTNTVNWLSLAEHPQLDVSCIRLRKGSQLNMLCHRLIVSRNAALRVSI